MKILIVARSVFIGGGVQSYVRSVSKELEANGHDVYYLSVSRHDCDSIEKHYHLPQFDSKFHKFLCRNFINPFLIIKTYGIVLKVRPDIIYLQNYHSMHLSMMIPLVFSSAPVIEIAHDYSFLTSPYFLNNHVIPKISIHNIKLMINYFLNFISPEHLNSVLCRKLSNRFFREVLVPTMDLFNWLKRYKVQNIKFVPLYPPNGTENAVHLKRKYKNHILFVGRIVRTKGIEFLLKAVKILKSEGANVKLSIVGTGDDLEMMQRLTGNLGINESVRFHGFLEKEKLNELYKKALCVVTPSIWKENACLVALEAFSHKRAVIATRRGAFPEYVIPGVTGLLAEPESETDLAKQIKKLLTDWKLAKIMGENGYELVQQKYSKSEHVGSLLKIFGAYERNFNLATNTEATAPQM